MSAENVYTGSCFCGEVQFEVSGQPAAMGYCHCASCRHWSAGPVNAFTLWPPDALKVTSGADRIGTFNKTPNSSRQWCTVCGGHLFTEHLSAASTGHLYPAGSAKAALRPATAPPARADRRPLPER